MSRLTQLYVFRHSLSVEQQLNELQQLVVPELQPIFSSVDFLVVNQNETDSHLISPLQIEQVRNLQTEVVRAPLQHPTRLFVLLEIQAASLPALNALLKLLEEPPAHAQFLLTTSQLQTVLETIQSRCQIIYVDTKNNQDESVGELPEALLSLSTESVPQLTFAQVFSISESYKERPKAITLVNNLIQAAQKRQQQQPTAFWMNFLQQALQAIKLLDQNVNTRLVLEELLFSFVQTRQTT